MNRIAVLDLETDPFDHGRMIYPFVAGFYDGETFTSWWSDDCVDRLVSHLESIEEPLTIYAHNGGRFDFFYFLKHIHANLRIVNGRIIQAWIGKHEIRDSFAIMPFALETYHKTKIDYGNFTKENRLAHRDEIVSYLRDDCIDLYDLCTAFVAEFGPTLTVGSAAMKQLQKFHSFVKGNAQYDARFRESFYFGGRNQVFKSGIIKGTIRVYDVNSMYPFVMRDYLHPVSTGIFPDRSVTTQTAFVSVEGRNYGAFPVRRKDNSLDFTVEKGTFHTTIHEFEAALETGTFKPTKILKTYGFSRRESFDEFVTHFYDARQKAKAVGDKIRTIFYKFVLNSAYGKFAQNPENYADWYITQVGEVPPNWHDCSKSCLEDCREKWSPAFISGNDYIIWEKPLKELYYYNIATGASITGASRAVLLRGIKAAQDPMYCDTDSIICRSMKGVTISDTELGAWKLEAEGNLAAIAGKKTYAIMQDETTVKIAHKGASHLYDRGKIRKIEGRDILRIVKGAEVEAVNPVPAFKWDGSYTWTKRTIRQTA